MGMAAGQARLLSITARMTDNENAGQALSYSKQRLADETEQVNAAYVAALEATKLTVLTGFNGSSPNYTDISYGLMTGYNTVACGRQYVVTNTKGQILVSKEYSNAFNNSNGDWNKFLASFGYTQCDIDVNSNDAYTKVHEAWDKYFTSVGLSFYDFEHDYEDSAIEFNYASFSNNAFDGYPTYLYKTTWGNLNNEPFEFDKNLYSENTPYYVGVMNNSEILLEREDDNYYYYNENNERTMYKGTYVDENGLKISIGDNPITGTREVITRNATLKVEEIAINYDGTDSEQRALYDYAVALTEALFGTSNSAGTMKTPAKDSENGNYITYLKNIFNQMAQFGFYTESDEASTIKGDTTYRGGSKSTSWFEQQLKEGKLLLKYFSTTEKDFVQTTLSDDDAIQEVEDERQIAIVEAKYTQDTAALEKKDQKIDLELKKLDTEHSALQTEYDSVKNIVDKNVEKSFNIFS